MQSALAVPDHQLRQRPERPQAADHAEQHVGCLLREDERAGARARVAEAGDDDPRAAGLAVADRHLGRGLPEVELADLPRPVDGALRDADEGVLTVVEEHPLAVVELPREVGLAVRGAVLGLGVLVGLVAERGVDLGGVEVEVHLVAIPHIDGLPPGVPDGEGSGETGRGLGLACHCGVSPSLVGLGGVAVRGAAGGAIRRLHLRAARPIRRSRCRGRRGRCRWRGLRLARSG